MSRSIDTWASRSSTSPECSRGSPNSFKPDRPETVSSSVSTWPTFVSRFGPGSEDLESKVMPFEDALRQIGARKIALEGLPVGIERSRVVNEMYQTFSDVTGIKRDGHVDETLAPRRIIGHLQDLLGV